MILVNAKNNLVVKIGRSLSVKCSSQTLDHLKILFQTDKRFAELKEYGVILNPSWFFKFSANYTLRNFVLNVDVKKFAYQSHYVDFLDENIQQLSRYTIGSN